MDADVKKSPSGEKEMTRIVDAFEKRYPGVHELEATYELLRKRSATPRRIGRALTTQDQGVVSTTTG